MQDRFAVCACLALSFLVSACSKSAPAPGKAVSIEQVCSEADGSRVRVTGHVRYPRGMLSFCSTIGGHKTCDLALYATAESPADFNMMRPSTGPEPPHARLSVPIGDQPGEMADLPKKFQASDVRVHLAGGTTAAEGTRITIDGKLSVIPSDPKGPDAPKSCFVTVEWAAAGSTLRGD